MCKTLCGFCAIRRRATRQRRGYYLWRRTFGRCTRAARTCGVAQACGVTQVRGVRTCLRACGVAQAGGAAQACGVAQAGGVRTCLRQAARTCGVAQAGGRASAAASIAQRRKGNDPFAKALKFQAVARKQTGAAKRDEGGIRSFFCGGGELLDERGQKI